MTNGFQIEKRDAGELTILYLKGFLDAHTTPIFEAEMEKLVSIGRCKIVVNFKDLTYIASSGLGVFMGFIEDVREKGGDIKLSNMSQKIYHVFEIVGFPSLYDILADESACIAKFEEARADV
ncbi:MAG: STAS domain-containing protein [Acidobacteriota bacterium]